MLTEVLYQLLLVTGIVVGIFLVLNLWHLLAVLKNFRGVSELVDSRARSLDKELEQLQHFVANIPAATKTFLLSFEVIKILRDHFEKAWEENIEEKGVHHE